MSNPQPNNPLHGITLEMILNQLVEQYGWVAGDGQCVARVAVHERGGVVRVATVVLDRPGQTPLPLGRQKEVSFHLRAAPRSEFAYDGEAEDMVEVIVLPKDRREEFNHV